jgi:molybdopterin-guanine dinucleotide biosynthesis protein MobB
VGVLKSASHINLDTKGKDTMRFMDAGCNKTAITSQKQSALFSKKMLGLKETVLEFFSDCGIVFIEGFKSYDLFNKIKVITNIDQIKEQSDDNIVAFYYDDKIDKDELGIVSELPVFSKETINELWKLISSFPPYSITLRVNDTDISMNNFVHTYIKNTIIAMVKSLHLKSDMINRIHIMWEKISTEADIKIIINGKPVPMKNFVKDIISGTLTGMISSLKLPSDEIQRIELLL